MDDKKKYIRLERHKWPDEVEAEKKVTKRRVIVIASCLLCFSIGFLVAHFGTSTKGNNTSALQFESDKLSQVYEAMSERWYFGKDIEDLQTFLIENAILGLSYSEIDPNTRYYGTEEGKKYTQRISGDSVGLGILYTIVNGECVVLTVYTDSPAAKIGIVPGDVLTKINGIAITGKESDEIQKLMYGDEGTNLTLGILRDNNNLEMTVARGSYSFSTGYEVKEGVGVIKIYSFAEKTHLEVEDTLKKFKKQGIDRIIIDLRDNSGGLVNSAIEIASFFMDSGKVFIYEEERDGTLKTYETKQRNNYNPKALTVLVNEDTASASEALAAALEEHVGATTIGTKTYGKGTVQIPIPFDDGSVFKFTSAQWLTPNKEKIHKKGITPKIVVENDPILTTSIVSDTSSYKVDSVGMGVKNMQLYLRHFGYTVDRVDGYYSQTTLEAVKKYQSDNGFVVNGTIDGKLLLDAYTKVVKEKTLQPEKYDSQMIKALEITKK